MLIKKAIKKVDTKEAPAAIGPYSQAVKVGNLLFASGMLPIDPSSGNMLESDIKIQTRQIFKNISAILSVEGLTLKNVVKTTVFLKNMGDFQAMNEVYKEALSSLEIMPARSAVEVAKLPKDSLIEIEIIASF